MDWYTFKMEVLWSFIKSQPTNHWHSITSQKAQNTNCKKHIAFIFRIKEWILYLHTSIGPPIDVIQFKLSPSLNFFDSMTCIKYHSISTQQLPVTSEAKGNNRLSHSTCHSTKSKTVLYEFQNMQLCLKLIPEYIIHKWILSKYTYYFNTF
jgi:hypothetical protein